MFQRASELRLTMARDCEVTSFRPQVCNLIDWTAKVVTGTINLEARVAGLGSR